MPPTQANIAKRLSVSRTSVFEMVNKLEAEGIIKKDKSITLTKKGLVHAENIVGKHRLAEEFLAEVMGLSWEEAHSEAGKWEHVISDKVKIKMEEMLGNPQTCPHGNPIPGKAKLNDNEVPLSLLKELDSFEILRIPETLETIPGELTRLHNQNVTPGSIGTVEKINSTQTVVKIQNKLIPLSNEVVSELKVLPTPPV